MKFHRHFIIAAGVLLFCVTGATADREPLPKVSGRITNEAKRPCANVEVRLFDENGELLKSTDSDGEGQFVCEHRNCHKCMLEIIPGDKTGLATALLDNIAGDKNHSFLVELHHGFVVSGRVISEGKGLKGIVVKVSPSDTGASGHADVHGGGFATTGRDGRFHMTLTPGAKQLHIYNTKYDELTRQHRQHFTVTGELVLEDIVLGPAKQE